MSKRKTYRIFLSVEDRIDADLEYQRVAGRAPRIRRFAITYSGRFGEDWRGVVRYHNFHGDLHCQRFWRSGQPEPLLAAKHALPDELFDACREDLESSWKRYRRLMEAKTKEE